MNPFRDTEIKVTRRQCMQLEKLLNAVVYLLTLFVESAIIYRYYLS